MKSKIKTTLIFFKKELISFWKYLSSKWLTLVSLLVFESIFLFGIAIIPSSFDNHVALEITERVSLNAVNSNFGYSVSTIKMTPLGNSDFYMFSSNKLQNIQMRNQQYDGVKSYAFAAYIPSDNVYPFQFTTNAGEKEKCAVVLFESKYSKDDFYFDLPLLAGSFERYVEKNNIIITDSVADKLLDGNQEYDFLIGKELESDSYSIYGASKSSFRITAVVGVSNNLGSVFSNFCGSDIIFMPEYNGFQMNGSFCFFASSSKAENKYIVEYIMDEFKSYSSASRGLEIGYKANYSFYDYSDDNKLYLGDTNSLLNKIIEFKHSALPLVLSITGIIISALFFVLITVSVRNSVNNQSPIGHYIFSNWLISSIAILINSFLYHFLSPLSIFAGVKLITLSTLVSTFLFLSWIILSLYICFLVVLKSKKKSNCDHSLL